MQQNIEPLKQLHSEKLHSEKLQSKTLHSEKVKSAGQVFLTIYFFSSLPSLLLLSLPSPFCLGLELSVWWEQVLSEVLLAGSISSG